MLGDFVAVVLPDVASDKFRLHALDFPGNPGIVRDGMQITLATPARTALDSLKPVVANATRILTTFP